MPIRPTAEPAVAVSSEHLLQLVQAAIAAHGPDCDLNPIDVSAIDDFDFVFEGNPFDGDISRWDVGRAQSMVHMFRNSVFNGDISNWDVSRVDNMEAMFEGSAFNGDISRWDATAASGGCMSKMFASSAFQGDLSAWRLDVHARGIHFMLGNKFQGIPPSPLQGPSLYFYHALFSSDKHLNEYMARMPFNGVHFDMSCLNANALVGLGMQGPHWCQTQVQMARALNISPAQWREHFYELHPERRRSTIDIFSLEQLVDE